MNLFLDDERLPRHVTWVDDYRYNHFDWNIVRTYEEFVTFISHHGLPNLISFDHDLADHHYQALMSGANHDEHKELEKTGYACAKWLAEYCIENDQAIPEYQVHSMNPIGKDNIVGILESARKHMNK